MDENLKQKIIVVISIIIGVYSFFVMAGWIFGIDFLTRIIPAGINMKFATAAAFFLASFALYFLFRIIKDNYELSFVILPVLALIILLTMGLIFTAGVASLQTGIEQLFTSPQYSIYASGSGMPALISIINFILFGLVCINSLVVSSSRQEIIKFVGWFMAIISLISLAGYLFSVKVLYFEVGTLTPISLNSVLLFLLLGCGLIVISKVKPAKTTNVA